MQPQDMILVSVDDHLVAPPNLFAGKMLSKFADEAPKVIRKGDGSEIWTFELAEVTAGVPDDEVNKITYETPAAGTTSTRSSTARESSAPWVPCGPRQRARRGDPYFDHGRFERTVGVSLGSSAPSSMSESPALRVAVVGASAGLGRCIGIGLAEKGAHVAFLARRHDRLVNAAKEAGNGRPPSSAT